MKEHSIKYFLDKYGTDSTTNFQLLRYARELKIPNFHCIMRNEFRVLKKLKRLPIFIVCNYQTTDENGTHWIAMYKDNKNTFYFDSYGVGLFNEAKAFLVHGVYSTFQIQPDGTKMCGILCLFVLYSLHNGRDFFDIVLELNNYFNIHARRSSLSNPTNKGE